MDKKKEVELDRKQPNKQKRLTQYTCKSCFMLLVLTIEYFTKAKYFQPNKTDRVTTTTR